MSRQSPGLIRPARPEDARAVEAVVHAAYSGYVDRIGKPPGPMLDDYAARIAAGSVAVAEDSAGAIAGIIVLIPEPDQLLLDNIAVRPDLQGQGFGRALIAFAEEEAQRLGCAEIRLYTHEKMTENIALYRRIGFVETGRGRQDGYDRVFMSKSLARRKRSGWP
jgi:ribosomal protein S18 acetylase RimI-like enzyme